jgi:hypothetical protein
MPRDRGRTDVDGSTQMVRPPLAIDADGFQPGQHLEFRGDLCRSAERHWQPRYDRA